MAFAVIIIAGCVTCANEGVYTVVVTPEGDSMIVYMEKGYFDDSNNFITEEEMEEVRKVWESENWKPKKL